MVNERPLPTLQRLGCRNCQNPGEEFLKVEKVPGLKSAVPPLLAWVTSLSLSCGIRLGSAGVRGGDRSVHTLHKLFLLGAL